ncbi:MAG TPA: folate-binding protein [Leucothrix mucor]|uniref:Folate-binding protein n=1 Tax=Leucothrix mucor TaxID=45248 RepID=A0A7V2WU53_LEUMU|nr:folate-binding protein [Leucothrix mucor]
MRQNWKEFLIDNGAEFHLGKLISFGNPSRESRIPPQGSVLSDLSDRGIIQVHGKDATNFLQNQLTNDISRVAEDSHQLSAWCNPKGRVIATFRIFKRNNNYYLTLSADLVELVIKKLRMFVMMSDVTIEDMSKSLIHFGYAGERAAQELQNIVADGYVPAEANQTLQQDTLSILRLSGTVPRFEVFGELEDAKNLWEHCNVRAAPVSSSGWDYLNIVAGLPVVSKASSTAWIPQMLNLQVIDGVDFNKGCFPGQEIVARLKYLGKNKRRMYRLEINSDELPEIGQEIYAEGESTYAGKILTAVINPAGKVEALAVMKIALVDKNLSLNKSEAGEQDSITLLDLPYSVE